MAIKRLHIFISTLLIATVNLSAQAYKIEINAPDFAGKQIIIAEYFTSRMVPKDTLDLNLLGTGIFTGKEAFDGGLYVLYFDRSPPFLILLWLRYIFYAIEM